MVKTAVAVGGGAKHKTKAKGKEEDEAYAAPKSGKDKKEKDPNAPKRPMSSYFLFMNDRRTGLKEEQPDLSFGQMTKELTEQWKKLTDTQKQKYTDMAEKDKARYQKEMVEKGLAKPAKDEEAPKRNQSAFFLFQAQARERIKKANPELKQTDLLKKTGEEWKNIDPKEKTKFEKLAAEDKVRYEKEKKEYDQKNEKPAVEKKGAVVVKGKCKGKKSIATKDQEDEESDSE